MTGCLLKSPLPEKHLFIPGRGRAASPPLPKFPERRPSITHGFSSQSGGKGLKTLPKWRIFVFTLLAGVTQRAATLRAHKRAGYKGTRSQGRRAGGEHTPQGHQRSLLPRGRASMVPAGMGVMRRPGWGRGPSPNPSQGSRPSWMGT